ncbi:glutamate--cysteine ligase, partial [Klebsiella aerogenes]|nr:glutamate--cysteine ligase [Klebsiella aerogenes]
RYTARHLTNERMWPMSMPCFIEAEDKITLAQFGTSNVGSFKTLYREGLKNRYGALMQTISGVHYNFSLPIEFWQAWANITDEETGKEA